MNKLFIVAIVVALALVGVYYWFSSHSVDDIVVDNVDEIAALDPNSPSTEVLNPTQINQENMQDESMSGVVKNDGHRVTIKTNKGDIVIQTYDADAPNTVANFVKLANEKFYDGVIFHRVIRGFMIQGGDPTGTGTGGPGYRFDDELNPATESYRNGYKRGVVAMANAGPNTNGSQFFIMHQDYPLPNNYTIFGHVVEGIEVVDAIANSQTLPGDRPAQEIVMEQVVVEKL